ncbi:hypothetical protein TanjilG_03832 [Lupinus angustifolius]|uniref:Inositol polyphosphate multikinase n=2 Tax=Lupinus angustifolius TaxID=3871 RepID=A0A1J7H003_LUPAN|nr:PREDICTED: inositol polyphosphate multikinase beta-like isoform X2 [Lupinus angustifolius]XP_019453402.1 PREDICTED: inositol polyphosphate multikinase beta-like isoform X2 [Lupinus angustifolius]OIV89199.1 hypothetical protein TanjilG_25112 [Lupinus angustifolius]OIW06207.1 hypothetical protein TanjilG_03832 [Lupinus angustifolius]
MLKIPNHQVAGHKAIDGILGPLIDDSGNFYKPLQNDDRGSNEVSFYESFNSEPRVPKSILKYFPIFHGTKIVNASDGSGLHPHLVLEDVASCYPNPSVMDVKIGSRTWYPQASEEYIKKCLDKDRVTSSITLGFRVSGLKLVGSVANEDDLSWQPDRKFLQNLSAEDVKLLLSKFVSSNMPSEDAAACPDRAFVEKVFGGSNGVLEQLLELKKWFEVQTIFHFYSCSVLMLYDKESLLNGKSSGGAVVKLVDFAHVVDAEGAIDHNFLGGLCSLIKFISDIIASPDDENCISNNNGTKYEH